MNRLIRALAVCAPAGSASLAGAQSYPSKVVRVVVPFAAGGPADIQARWLAGRLSSALDPQFIVENKGGAGGLLGAQAVTRP